MKSKSKDKDGHTESLTLTSEEMEIIYKYRNLTPAGKAFIMEIRKMLKAYSDYRG